MLINEVLQQAEKACNDASKDAHPARLLLMHVLNFESYELFANLDSEIDPDKKNEFETLLKRYVSENEPVQYIIGYEYFAGRNLYVDAGALIPRPETEELVYEILFLIDEHFPVEEYQKIKMADVGTGSGAIAVSLAAEEPRVEMIATDISEDALGVARKNANAYAENISFITGDMLQPLIDAKVQLDILVSNPPYIPVEEDVQDIVKENEPHVALFGGDDGLFFYRKIIENASKVVKKRSLIAFEMGFDQGDRLMALAKEYFPKATIYVKKDMQNKDRMLFIENNL